MKEKLKIIFAVFTAACFFLIVPSASGTHSPDRSKTDHIARFIQKKLAEEQKILSIQGERLRGIELLKDFYGKRGYRPAWLDGNVLRTQVYALIAAIEKAENEGLTPDNYHLKKIKALTQELQRGVIESGGPSADMRADLDLLLSDAYLLLGCHYSAGCVNPLTLQADWHVKPGHTDVAAIFGKAIEEDRIMESLQRLLPSQEVYSELKKNLVSYRKLSQLGGWPAINEGKPLKKGIRDSRVPDLRQRLEISGYLSPAINKDSDTFDSSLEDAVIEFQRLHGLRTDGVVGPVTLRALNVTAKARARQIELNMERLRWVAKRLGDRYIMVNIADFTLTVIERGNAVLSMKVIVGKPYWHTPVFSEKMTYLVLNPYWNVPDSIAREEIIPKIRRDPEYLEKENMKVLSGWEQNSASIDPGSVEWDAAGASAFKYRFRQEPGPRNPLGRIKFMFPNRFDVYLHDTPGKHLFERNVRSFSHGCIRVEKPIELAEYVLKQDPRWTLKRINAELAEGNTREIRLPNPVDVYILYLTAWVDGGGLLNFREDIYGRDAKLDAEMKKPPPS
jgi:L,D-transpeptidase YcbB